jgi:hypothetical protein
LASFQSSHEKKRWNMYWCKLMRDSRTRRKPRRALKGLLWFC